MSILNVPKLTLGTSSVIVNLSANNAAEAITKLGETLVHLGTVQEGYIDDVLKREESYPTGLPTVIPVAIPHAAPANCVNTSMAIGVLETPVSFKEMGTPTNRLDVEMIFLLALKNIEEQTEWLRNLMRMFKDKELLEQLRTCKNEETIVQLVTGALKVES